MKNVIWLENFYTDDSLEVYDLVLLTGALSTSYDIEFRHFHVPISHMYVNVKLIMFLLLLLIQSIHIY